MCLFFSVVSQQSSEKNYININMFKWLLPNFNISLHLTSVILFKFLFKSNFFTKISTNVSRWCLNWFHSFYFWIKLFFLLNMLKCSYLLLPGAAYIFVFLWSQTKAKWLKIVPKLDLMVLQTIYILWLYSVHVVLLTLS